jgi:hypothetical protein
MQKNVANAMAAKCSSQKEEDHLIIIISSVARLEQCTKKMISHFEPSKSIIILHSNIQQNNHISDMAENHHKSRHVNGKINYLCNNLIHGEQCHLVMKNISGPVF